MDVKIITLWAAVLTGGASLQAAEAAVGSSSHVAPEVSFTIVRGTPLGMGLDLIVNNRTSAPICIPERSLKADSGSLVAYRGAKLFASQSNDEYLPGYPASGLYYVAPRHSTSTFP